MSGPLVSCVMPTADRPEFVELATRCFLQQTYPATELIVVDDGRHAVGRLLPRLPNVRYHRPVERLPLGEKRNLACALARGDIVAHWDDDDWSAPSRLSEQVAALCTPGANVCGLSALRYFEPTSRRAWMWRRERGDRWLFGSSLCYRREAWLRAPFPVVDRGEDAAFLSALAPAECRDLGDADLLIGVVHARNTSARPGTGPDWHPLRSDEVTRALGADLDAVSAAAA